MGKILEKPAKFHGSDFALSFTIYKINFMRIISYKLLLLYRLAQLKGAELLGNRNNHQHLLEQLVSLHIRLQLAKEQAYNKQLFTSV